MLMFTCVSLWINVKYIIYQQLVLKYLRIPVQMYNSVQCMYICLWSRPAIIYNVYFRIHHILYLVCFIISNQNCSEWNFCTPSFAESCHIWNNKMRNTKIYFSCIQPISNCSYIHVHNWLKIQMLAVHSFLSMPWAACRLALTTMKNKSNIPGGFFVELYFPNKVAT